MIPVLIFISLWSGLIGLAWFCYRAYFFHKTHTEEIKALGKFGLLRLMQQQSRQLWRVLWLSLLVLILALLLSWQQTYQKAHRLSQQNSEMIVRAKYWQPWIDHFKQNGVRAIYTLDEDERYHRQEGVLHIHILQTEQDWPSSTAPRMSVSFCDNSCANENSDNEIVVLNHQAWQLQIPRSLLKTHYVNQVRAAKIVFMLYQRSNSFARDEL